MAENEISDYNETDADNVDIAGVTVQENVMKPSNVNNAFRALQGALKRWFKSSLFRLRDSTDQTKLLAFDLSGLPTGTTTTVSFPIATQQNVCQGRLTLTSGTAVTTADVTAAASLYFTPFRGNQIGLYTGTNWVVRSFSELTLSLAGYTAGKCFDIFAYDNAGVVALESLVWSSDHSRATAIVMQDGIWCKSGALTRRYLGTIYTQALGQTEDSFAARMVWNYYNRAPRALRKTESADSWTYTTATVRSANGSSSNRVDFVVGVSEDMVALEVKATASNAVASTTMLAGVGVDSFTAFASGFIANSANSPGNFIVPIGGTWRGCPVAGRTYGSWLEYSQASGTTTFYGDGGFPALFQSGIFGEVWA